MQNYEVFELTHLFSGFTDAEYIIHDFDSLFWIAEKSFGVVKCSFDSYIDTILPLGPKSIDIHSLNFANDKLYVSHGGYIKFNYLGNKDGVSVMDKFNIWGNYDYYDLNKSRDVLEVAIFDDNIFFGCWGDGIVVLKNGLYFTTYNHQSTNGVLDTISWRETNNKIRVSDLKLDGYGNLWGLSSEVENPLFVKENNGLGIHSL